MPPPFEVTLFPYDSAWPQAAALEGQIIQAAAAAVILTVHHIGSTAIPGISAKSILDLLPVVSSLTDLDNQRLSIEALGYQWWGEFGLPGRRYCTKSDPETSRRLVQLHFFAVGSSEIIRHLAFRDYLRNHPDIAQAYNREKSRCRNLHPDNSHAYADCKSHWIKAIEVEALKSVSR